SFEDFKQSVEKFKPNYIAVDSGSTDPGPYYIGAGESFTSHETVKRELELLIGTALEKDIPLIIGSAGGSGGRPHVNWVFNIVKELSLEKGWDIPVATIDAEMDKDRLLK